MKKLIFLIALMSIFLMACESDGAGTIKEEPSGMEYNVVRKEDISLGGAVRYSWDVVVDGKPSKADLEALSKELVEEAKKEEEFNAMVLGFYDYEEYVGYGYTLGKTTYAPEGDWEKAGDIKTGDYSKMDYTFELREKDWDKQLTEEEIKIYKAWKDLYAEKDSDDEFPDEEEVSAEVAEEHGITPDDVDSVFIKDMEWMFNGISE